MALPYPTVRDAAEQLVLTGALVRTSGTYSLATTPLPDREARAIVQLIVDSGLDAHLTGLDLLAHWWQQFSFRTSHLVYADPDSADAITQALNEGGFVVVHLDRTQRPVLPETPASISVVFLRTQSADFSARFGVVGGRASIEKAWLDAVRESRRQILPLTLYDLGQILGAALADRAVDRRRLNNLARRAKLPFVIAALDERQPSGEAGELAAGIMSERAARGD